MEKTDYPQDNRARAFDAREFAKTSLGGPRAVHPTIEHAHMATGDAESALDQLRAYRAELEQELASVNETIDHVSKRLSNAIAGPAATPGLNRLSR